MNDLPTEETIRTAFAELRYAEPPRFAPPGVDAARRTVRRRRITRTTTTAGLAGVALLGAGYVAVLALALPEPTGGTDSIPATTPIGPSESPYLIEPIVTPEQQRLNAIVYEVLDWPGLDSLPDDAVGGSVSGAGTFVGQSDHVRIEQASSPSSWDTLAQGTYTIRLGCAAEQGTIRVVVQVGGSQLSGTAQCGDTEELAEAGLAEVTFTVADDEDPVVSLELDQEAIATSPDLSFGYVIDRQ